MLAVASEELSSRRRPRILIRETLVSGGVLRGANCVTSSFLQKSLIAGPNVNPVAEEQTAGAEADCQQREVEKAKSNGLESEADANI